MKVNFKPFCSLLLLLLCVPGRAAEIHDLCARGDVAAVQRLLRQQPGLVNARGENGMTPLFFARNANVMRLLLTHGARVDARDANGRTRLFGTRDPDMMRLLLSRGLRANARDRFGETPLMTAIGGYLLPWERRGTPGASERDAGPARDSLQAARLLLAKGADVNARSNDGITALFSAQTAAEVSLLLAHRAKAIGVSRLGTSPLSNKTGAAMKLLLRAGAHPGPNDTLPGLDADAARLLIKLGVDARKVEPTRRQNALFEARDAETVRVLLAAGAARDQRDTFGRTPLHCAHYPGVVQALVQAGSEVEARDNEGKTPLMTVDILDVMQALLDAGADVKARSAQGLTPLLCCAVSRSDYSRNRKADMLRLLLARGADVNEESAGGKNPPLPPGGAYGGMDLFGFEPGQNVLALLPYYHYPPGSPLSPGPPPADLVQMLLEKGADPDGGTGKPYDFPLRKVIDVGRDDLADLLVRSGANWRWQQHGNSAILDDPHVPRGRVLESGCTLLFLCCLNTTVPPLNEMRDPGKARIATLLIRKGLDVNQRTTHQQATPLHYAAREGNIPVAEALLAQGADVNARTADYRFRFYPQGSRAPAEEDETYAPHGERTPLGWALAYRQTQFAAWLRQHGGTE